MLSSLLKYRNIIKLRFILKSMKNLRAKLNILGLKAKCVLYELAIFAEASTGGEIAPEISQNICGQYDEKLADCKSKISNYFSKIGDDANAKKYANKAKILYDLSKRKLGNTK